MGSVKKLVLVILTIVLCLPFCACDEILFDVMLETCIDACIDTCSDQLILNCGDDFNSENLTKYTLLNQNDSAQIESISLMQVSGAAGSCSSTYLQYSSVAEIEDTAAFMEEFSTLKCWDSNNTYSVEKPVSTPQYDRLICIAYTDGKYEMISIVESYLTDNLESDHKLAYGFMMFDKSEYNSFWDKWAA